MILTALLDLAEAEGLLADPGFAPDDVHWLAVVGKDGRLVQLVDARRPDDRGTPRPVRLRMPARFQRSGTAPPPRFLCDNSQYVLGFGFKPDGERTPTPDRQGAFRKLIDEAVADTGDEGLAAVAALARRVEKGEIGLGKELPEDLGKGDWIAFRLEGETGQVSDRPAVSAWWCERHERTEPPSAQCLVTGEACAPVEKHDPIRHMGGAAQTALVTYNDAAFESYGLVRNANGPIGARAATGSVAALNRLLDPVAERRRHIRTGTNTKIVFWAEPGGREVEDLFLACFDSSDDPASMGALLKSPLRGRLPEFDPSARFYALTLSSEQARVAVRDWFVTNVETVESRLREYFADLDLAFPFEEAPPPSLWDLMRSLALRGDVKKHLPPSLPAQFFRGILRGTPLSGQLLAAAIRRIDAEGPLSTRLGDRPDWNRAHLRFQLVKLCLIRHHAGKRQEVPAMLDESNHEVPYLLGRMFAILERLQQDAQGRVGAGIGDRYYGSASSTPSIVLPLLIRLSKHHDSKLARENPGLAVVRRRQIGSVMDALPAEKFPASLPLEEQGLFALGYYQQVQSFFRPREREEKDQPEGSAA